MMSYSVDLRERVVSYVESGNSRIAAAKFFKVGEKTLQRWIALKHETGTLSPKPHGGGYPPKIDLSELKKIVDAHPNKTLADLQKDFPVAAVSLWHALKKLKYTYKKKHSVPRKGFWKKS